MATRDKKRKPTTATPKDPGILGKLDGAESASVLKALLHRNPELRSEAEALAKEALGEVSFLSIADAVETDVLQFDYDDLNSRAGRHSGGYIEPGEAANELMEEAVEPFVSEMKRYLELKMEKQARESCQGILLGLYRAWDCNDNDVLNWAEDFPAEAAGNALEVWMEAAGAKPRRLSSRFARQHLPKWDWVLKLCAEEGGLAS